MDATDRVELKRWLQGVSAATNVARLRLFCFPYAGAGASLFRGWQGAMPANVELLPVQLPGREARWDDPVFLDMNTLARELTIALRPLFETPYALYGHSMGGLIAFELARQLRRARMNMPLHLFVSSARAPHLADRELPLHQLPDALILEQLYGRFGEASGQALRNADLARALLPTLRADFTLCETYQPAPEPPLNVPITVYSGRGDRMVVFNDIVSWSVHTQRGFRVQLFAGDHFFINQQRETFVRTLSDDVASVARQLDNAA